MNLQKMASGIMREIFILNSYGKRHKSLFENSHCALSEKTVINNFIRFVFFAGILPLTVKPEDRGRATATDNPVLINSAPLTCEKNGGCRLSEHQKDKKE